MPAPCWKTWTAVPTSEGHNRSGGGIVHGAGVRSSGVIPASAVDLVAGIRRRWASGVAVVTARERDGSLRGITVTSLMVVAQEPPILAVALTASGSFHELAPVDAVLGVSLLDSSHEFLTERFAGRAPVPDARFAGVPHRIEGGVPILDDASAWCIVRVSSRQDAGDHVLVLLNIKDSALGPDTDDPLLRYEGRYRRLEAG